MTAAQRPTQTPRRFRLGRWTIGVLALILAVAALAVPRLSASAATLPGGGQCDGGNGPGSAIACDVEVVNNLNLATHEANSTVKVERHCAGIDVNCQETGGTTTNNPTQLITDIAQCNTTGNGGGSRLACNVNVTNKIVGNATAIAVTVNQCNGSGAGLLLSSVNCSPFPATTAGADITQCNGSANGLTLVTVHCTVTADSTKSAALPITVNQCNGAVNGGGSSVTCTVKISNRVTAPQTGGPGSGPTAPTRPATPPATAGGGGGGGQTAGGGTPITDTPITSTPTNGTRPPAIGPPDTGGSGQTPGEDTTRAGTPGTGGGGLPRGSSAMAQVRADSNVAGFALVLAVIGLIARCAVRARRRWLNPR